MNVKIREELRADFEAIDEVVAGAFKGQDEVKIVRNIRESSGYKKRLSLIAELNATIVGHVMLSGIEIECDSASVSALALAPLAVHKDFQVSLFKAIF